MATVFAILKPERFLRRSEPERNVGEDIKMSQQRDRGGFKPEWTFAKEFFDEATGVAVVVNKTNHHVPQYSFKLGRYNGDSPLLPFIGARVTKDNLFSGILECGNIDAALRLLTEMKDWMKKDLAYACDQAQQAAEARERAAANRDKPQTRVTGKTEKKKGGKARIPAEQESAPAQAAAA